jgi:argininosuccinate synthase
VTFAWVAGRAVDGLRCPPSVLIPPRLPCRPPPRYPLTADLTDPLAIYLYLNKIGGEHGVGRVDVVENRFVGIKSRGVYEAPGAEILRAAHIGVEGLTLDREVFRLRDTLSARFADLCYNGFWFSPEMDFILAAVKKSQEVRRRPRWG